MRKLLLSLIISITCIAQGQTIEFESNIIDYGIITHNSDGKREFKFTNTGDKLLIISTVKGSCGCTIPSYKKPDGSSEWQPGEVGSIKVKYDTNRIGRFTKNITLITNSNNQTPIILTITGEIIQKK